MHEVGHYLTKLAMTYNLFISSSLYSSSLDEGPLRIQSPTRTTRMVAAFGWLVRWMKHGWRLKGHQEVGTNCNQNHSMKDITL